MSPSGFLWKEELFFLPIKLLLGLVSLVFLTACAPLEALPPLTAEATKPARLYVYDVRPLHLDHYALCGGPCPPDAAPPAGKTYADLLNDYDRLIFLSSLQGIVNKEKPQLYLIHHPSDQFWLETFQEAGQPYGWLSETDVIVLPDLAAVLETFAGEITGLVAWDAAVPATLNVATTIAGVEGWPIVRHGSPLAQALSAHWPVQQSLAGQFADNLAAYTWAMERYLQTGRANYTLLAYLEDGWPAVQYQGGRMTGGGVYSLERDYVIQQGGFAFDLSPWRDEAPAEAELLSTILQAARREAGLKLTKIWGFIPWYDKYAAEPGRGGSHHPIEGEWESTWLFSYYASYLQGGGGDAWGAAMANVSVHRFAPKPRPVATTPTTPPIADLTAKGYLLPDGSVNPDLTFILFYAGDYDLVHPTLVALAGWERSTWVEAGRGEIPIAWGINPGMEEEIPGVMRYLLATRTGSDYLVAANSGAGYVNPQALSRRYRRQWLTRAEDYYAKYGLTIQGFLLNGRGYDLPMAWVQRFAKIAPDGIIAPDFEIVVEWPLLVNDTPYIGMTRETLGDSVEGSAQVAHLAYRQALAEGRPPFLVLRSSFQTPHFLAQVYNQMRTDDVNDRIVVEAGTALHPHYTLVDPYTFFALLKIRLSR
jgi:hypothetical protein